MIYSRLFAWMVVHINSSLQSNCDGGDGLTQARFFIGILDIFGFEILAHNSLEQLCINFTNEKLQAAFNQAVFQAAMEENAEEGVEVEVADMTEIDNQECIELIEGHPRGILPMLNEECVVPKGSDQSFVDKMFQQARAHLLTAHPPHTTLNLHALHVWCNIAAHHEQATQAAAQEA